MFCKEHAEPRLVLIGHGPSIIENTPTGLKQEYEADYRKKGGHPCTNWTIINSRRLKAEKLFNEAKYATILGHKSLDEEIKIRLSYLDVEEQKEIEPILATLVEQEKHRVKLLKEEGGTEYEFSAKRPREIDFDLNACEYCKTSPVSLSECSSCGRMFCMYHRDQRSHKCPAFIEELKRQRKESEEINKNLKIEKEKINARNRWIAILFVLIIGAALFISVMSSVLKYLQPCSDKTRGGSCSSNKPYYCMDGELVYSPERCGCPDGYAAESGVCKKLLICTDGTAYGNCSQILPFFCDNGSLTNNAQVCGCPNSEIIANATCKTPQNCSDGTSHGQCSTDKPLFCFDGTLTQNSSLCGCPNGYLPGGQDCRIAVNCNDGTQDSSCSSNQPNYCYNGTLFENASACGCPNGYLPHGDNCESWGDDFFSDVASDRGAAYQYCPSLSEYAQLRFSTMSNNIEISHYGSETDMQSFFGTVYNTWFEEEVLYPAGSSPSDYIDNLQVVAPLHWQGLIDPKYAYYGYYMADGPSYEIYQPCPTTEIPGPNINISQFYSSMGCSFTIDTSTWFVVELASDCPGKVGG